ncbi:cadherin-like beta sandwich domain-containing protein [Mesorhizobium sp. STM 4661]|uniref:cadherin-like beta sandwich domain-containing protein n=1 Tax=Mesorhizobium sp. STM 4661 TaxID=1297570 RepID=UPI0018DEE512|nr:cadherin-like beta sandwich domain-containing protein [Mesorhizobium sp. STM 4661]
MSTAGGTPRIALTIGGTTRFANYASGSGTTELSFGYTVQAGEIDLDGIQVGAAIQANGGTIGNFDGTVSADLALNNVASTSGVFVYAIAPIVLSTGIVGTPPSDADDVTFEIVFSEPVTGVRLEDFTLVGGDSASGTLSTLQTTDNIRYTVNAAVAGFGPLRVDVRANAAVNIGGEGNPAYASGTPWTRASSNADLAQLQPSKGTLTPAFDPDVLGYAVSVANDVTEVALTLSVAGPNATIKVNGLAVASGSASAAIPLSVGATEIAIDVTAQNGTTVKAYKVTVTRGAAAIADLVGLVPSVGGLDPAFSPDTLAYRLDVANGVTTVTLTPTAADPNATIKVNGSAVASGSASAAIPLSVGATEIAIDVTAQNGTTMKAYKVTVTRGAGAIADLVGLVPSVGGLDPAFSPDTLAYRLDVANGVTTVTLTPTAADAASSITIDGNTVASGSASTAIALSVGSRQVDVVVTAQDGTTVKSYRVDISRAASPKAELTGLVPSVGSLDPAFGPDTLVYKLDVANAVTSITLTPTATDATITVNGAAVTPGSASTALSLVEGTTEISVVVTAQDGVTTQTYTVNAVRQKPAPVAVSRTVEVQAGTTANIDLTEGASGGPFTAAAITSVSDPDAGNLRLEAQSLVFDASPTFSGSAQVAFTLSNAFGTSPAATITFAVIARPDPSRDSEVIGLLQAQVDAARRFAETQTDNFNTRLEQLHAKATAVKIP